MGLELIASAVNSFVATISTAWTTFTTGIKTAWDGLWNGIKDFLTGEEGPLGAIKDTISGFTGAVTGFFSSMYDTVVGNSIVKDLVKDIGVEFNTLNSKMVTPTKTATDGVGGLFGGLLTAVQDQIGTGSRWERILKQGVNIVNSTFRNGINSALRGSEGVASVFSGLLVVVGGWLDGKGTWGAILNKGISVLGSFFKGGVSGILEDIVGEGGIGGFGGFLKKLGVDFGKGGGGQSILKGAIDIFNLDFMDLITDKLLDIGDRFAYFLNGIVFTILDQVGSINDFLGGFNPFDDWPFGSWGVNTLVAPGPGPVNSVGTPGLGVGGNVTVNVQGSIIAEADLEDKIQEVLDRRTRRGAF